MASDFAKITILAKNPRVFFPNKDAELLIPALTGKKVNGIAKTEILGYKLSPGIYSLQGDQKGTLKVSKIKNLN